MKRHKEESSLRISTVAVYTMLAIFIGSIYVFEDEVKQRLDLQLDKVTVVEVAAASEVLPIRNIWITNLKADCDTYRYFVGSTIGVTSKSGVESMMSSDPSFRKIQANRFSTTYLRKPGATIPEQILTFMYDANKILVGGVVTTPLLRMEIMNVFLEDQGRYHKCTGLPTEPPAHGTFEDNTHIDSLRLVYPNGIVINFFVLSSPATVADGLVDEFVYMISTPEKEDVFKRLLMEAFTDGKKETNGRMPPLPQPHTT